MSVQISFIGEALLQLGQGNFCFGGSFSQKGRNLLNRPHLFFNHPVGLLKRGCPLSRPFELSEKNGPESVYFPDSSIPVRDRLMAGCLELFFKRLFTIPSMLRQPSVIKAYQSCSETEVSEQQPLENGKMRSILEDLFENQPGS
jgi:hypothetical protein